MTVRPLSSFAHKTSEWKITPSKAENIPKWIHRLDFPPAEVQRTLFQHASGREYEIGIWAQGDYQNRPALEEIKAKLLPNLELALKQQHLPVSVTSIKAAMVMAGRLPLCKVVHHLLNDSFAVHACLTSQPTEEAKEVYCAFEQQIKRKTEQIEADIQRQKQEANAHFDRLGCSQEEGWKALERLSAQEGAKPSGQITVTETGEISFPPTADFSLPSPINKEEAVKISEKEFKHRTGRLYGVAVWAYPFKSASEAKELIRAHSLLNTTLLKVDRSLAKELSAALERHHHPLSFLALAAASKLAGRASLYDATCRLPDRDVFIKALVCRQPAGEAEEVQRSFDRQIKGDIFPNVIEYHFRKLGPEHYIRYRPQSLVGAPSDDPLLGMILWKDRLKETEMLLQWSEDEGLFNKHLKWLADWEREHESASS